MSTPAPLPPTEATPAASTPVARGKFALNPRFTFEAILILLSVLLGFGVSEWRQVQVDQDLAARLRSNLFTEIEYNRALLETFLPRHQKLVMLLEAVDVSDSQLTGWDVLLPKINDVGGGVGKPALRRGAWDAAVSTGALRLLDYELAAELSEIYNVQEDVRRSFDMVVVSIYQTSTFQPGLQRETVQVLKGNISEMENMEELLLVLYNTYLAEGGAARQ